MCIYCWTVAHAGRGNPCAIGDRAGECSAGDEGTREGDDLVRDTRVRGDADLDELASHDVAVCALSVVVESNRLRLRADCGPARNHDHSAHDSPVELGCRNRVRVARCVRYRRGTTAATFAVSQPGTRHVRSSIPALLPRFSDLHKKHSRGIGLDINGAAHDPADLPKLTAMVTKTEVGNRHGA